MNKTILLFTTLSILSIHSQEAEVPVNEALLTSSKESKSSSISCKKYQYIAAVSTALLISSILIYILTPYPDTSTLRGFLKVAGYDKIYIFHAPSNTFLVTKKDKKYAIIDTNISLINYENVKTLTLHDFAMKQISKQEFTPDELKYKKYYQSVIDDCVFLIQNAKAFQDKKYYATLSHSNIDFFLDRVVINMSLQLPTELQLSQSTEQIC